MNETNSITDDNEIHATMRRLKAIWPGCGISIDMRYQYMDYLDQNDEGCNYGVYLRLLKDGPLVGGNGTTLAGAVDSLMKRMAAEPPEKHYREQLAEAERQVQRLRAALAALPAPFAQAAIDTTGAVVMGGKGAE